jgi:hypothetical protein
MTATTLFELERRNTADGRPGVIFVRARRRRTAPAPARTPGAPVAGQRIAD